MILSLLIKAIDILFYNINFFKLEFVLLDFPWGKYTPFGNSRSLVQGSLNYSRELKFNLVKDVNKKIKILDFYLSFKKFLKDSLPSSGAPAWQRDRFSPF